MQLQKLKENLYVPTDFGKYHHYYADAAGEKEYTGVTSVINVLAKPALIGWAARMACDYIRENVAYAIPGTDGGYWAIKPSCVEEAKDAHRKKKEAAGTHGTDAHALVEAWINQCLTEHEGKPVNDYAFDGDDPILPFKAWAVENVDHFLYAERRMASTELYVAGTADFGCVLKTGQKLIGDFKTSSGIYGIDYYLQCAGYKILAEGEGDTPYDGCVIVRLGKKGSKDFDVTYNYDCATAEKSFMACLTLYRAQAALKETAIRE